MKALLLFVIFVGASMPLFAQSTHVVFSCKEPGVATPSGEHTFSIQILKTAGAYKADIEYIDGTKTGAEKIVDRYVVESVALWPAQKMDRYLGSSVFRILDNGTREEIQDGNLMVGVLRGPYYKHQAEIDFSDDNKLNISFGSECR